MVMTITCPSCAAKLNASEKMAGKKTKCPKCGSLLAMPLSTGPQLPPASKLAVQSKASKQESLSSEIDGESFVAAKPRASITPAIEFTCSECGANYDVEGDLAGKVIRCRNCHDFQ